MKKTWNNILVIALTAIVSAGVAIGTTSYILNKNHITSEVSTETNSGFKQSSFRLANLVAAENIDFTVAAEKAVHAVVHIKSVAKSSGRQQQFMDPFEFFFGMPRNRQMEMQPRVGFGSGVIISTDGYIITNNHVIDGADELEVTLNDNRKFDARIIGKDPNTDIALIKIKGDNLETIPFGNSDELKVGEWVLAIGNPFNLTSTVTAGIVSAKGRSISAGNPREQNRSKIESFIQTDAAVNPGNSGGALINTKGELVGINTALYSETGNFAGYSFAVPISIAERVVSDLKQYGSVQRAMLGVSMTSVDVAKTQDEKIKAIEGAYVAEFAERSSAKEAGMKVGDVIIAVNNIKVKTPSDLQLEISKYRPGEKIKVKVDRYGSEKTLNVTLRNVQGGTEVIKGGDSSEVLGAALKALTDDQKEEYGVSYGVEVTGVTSGKFKSAGIQKGFIIMLVNNQRISTPEDLLRIVDGILKGASSEQGIFIKGFYANGRTRYYAIDLINE